MRGIIAKLLFTTLITGFLLLFFVYPYCRWKNRSPQRFTIGYFKGLSNTRGAYVPVFTYHINDDKIETVGLYQNTVTPWNKKVYLNRRFYVVFEISKPKNGILLLDYPVPDSIKTAPPFGWDSIPGLGELEIPFVWDGGKSPPIKKK